MSTADLSGLGRPSSIRMTTHRNRDRLTVLHVATINKPIGTDLGYGPIETIIENIHEGVQALGHRSIVACSADSRITGERYVTVPRSLGDYWVDDTAERRGVVNTHLSRALDRATMGDIDVIHMHEWAARVYDGAFNPPLPIVMTLHVPAHESGLRHGHQCGGDTPSRRSVYFVAISDYQERQYAARVHTWSTIHHGIGVDGFPFKQRPDHDSYLLTIGRVSRVKGQHHAIAVARRTGAKLVIAGCVQNKREDVAFFESLKSSIDLFVDVGAYPVETDYYETVIKPLVDCDKQVIYIGELRSDQKQQWYRHARATVFPIQWGEPFGLVLVESMACGTPILAFNEGAVPEIVVDGLTGFVVDSRDEMIDALGRIDGLDPRTCRRHVSDRFSIATMARKYAAMYQEVISDYRHPDMIRGPLIETRSSAAKDEEVIDAQRPSHQ